LATSRAIKPLRAAKKKIFVWTVNREREMRHFAELGVDGLISDDTKLLAATMEGTKPTL
jgi:glycerophosphoryl diester phosphodiesterase